MGKVYVVDVWPGRALDLTLRALRVLRQVDLVVARDEAGVSALLRECDVSTAVRAIGQGGALSTILDALERGDVAWASEGATTWEAWESSLAEALLSQGVELVSIPGPVAAIVGLVTSGLPADRFAFLGTLPAGTDERRAVLYGVRQEVHTLVCGVASEQLEQALGDLHTALGDRQVAICSGQQVWRGKLSQARSRPADGQVVLVIAGAEEAEAWTEEEVRRELQSMLLHGSSVRDAARTVASLSGWPRRQVYQSAMRMMGDD